jgi:aminomethyltransferase
MNLFGNDMDEDQSPLESGLTWTIAFEPAERHFIGRAALEAQQRAGVQRKLVGLLLEERGVALHQAVIVDGQPNGEIRRYVLADFGHRCWRACDRCAGNEVDIRGKQLARIVRIVYAMVKLVLNCRVARGDPPSQTGRFANTMQKFY